MGVLPASLRGTHTMGSWGICGREHEEGLVRGLASGVGGCKGGLEEPGFVLGCVLSGSRGNWMIRQYFSPRRQEKWSSSHLGQAGGGCLLIWRWPEGGCFHLCLGVMKECSLFVLLHHRHKASSSDTDVLGNCVCSGQTGTAWPGARGQLLAVVQQVCFSLFHPLLQTLFSSGGSGLEGKKPCFKSPRRQGSPEPATCLRQGRRDVHREETGSHL